MLDPHNWLLDSYTNDQWTTLVAEANPVVLSTLVVANTSGASRIVQMRIDDGSDTKLAVIIPGAEIIPGENTRLDVQSLCLQGGQRLQVRVDGAGIEFTASGAIAP